MATMKLKNINKIYPSGVQAVFDFNMDIADGEFIVLVGPSGCGKSTTLRMIAGLEDITSGTLLLDDKNINNLAPKDRDISMVFQNYALYAHMTVYHNMAFSLVLRKERAEVIHERVMWAADILGLVPYLNRKPTHLSGGQRQRVAVGRSIVRNPKVFLFDEPLSNLDAKLRAIMRKELKLLHTRLQSTMIYVTHDQIEALTLADRIVVMNKGYVQQIGSPTEIYTDPKNLFVANFIGTPPMNIFNTILNDDLSFNIEDRKVDLSKVSVLDNLMNFKGKEIVIGIRPEHVIVESDNGMNEGISAVVINYELLGASALIHFMVTGQRVIAKVDERVVFHKGDKIVFKFSLDNTYFFDKETENRIYSISHEGGAS
jgi:multiple sugar transport system ATP-binding protein